MTIRRMSGLEVCMYAVGDVVSFPKAVDPNQKYIHTAWKRIKGRVVVGVDENDADFASDNKTGGAKTHTLTVAQMPSHSHNVLGVNDGASVSTSYGNYPARIYQDKNPNWDVSFINTSGGSQAHNNLQPFITKYLWERIA